VAARQTAAEQRAVLASVFLGRRHTLYRQTENPIHMWSAFRIARHLRVEIPAWVLDALDGYARAVLRGEAPIKWRRGGPSARRQAETDERDLAIVQAVWRQQQAGALDECAFATVATHYGLSPLTVKNVYYTWLPPASRR
jgi:hypothetical protein